MLTADPQALIGAVLNQKLKLTRLLGEGGLASVYEAQDLAEGGFVAVKLLKNEFSSDPEVVERFLTEGPTSQKVQHPNVVRILGAYRAENGVPYIAMELLSGHPLSVPMNRGRLPVERATQVARELLDALAAAHAGGVVHRDLKPDNVFLVPDREGREHVKLLDFGISRVIDAAGGMGRKTRTGMLLGTPGYMSPEQVKNPKYADQRSDLFAVGVLFFEMLTGERAFDAATDFERVTCVLYADPRRIEQVAPQFAHWAAFFARALRREPEHRFQTAEEMREYIVSVGTSGRLPSQPPARFGGDSTAVSPQASHGSSMQAPLGRSAPPVQVVELPPRTLDVPWWLALGASLFTFLFGILIGWLVFG